MSKKISYCLPVYNAQATIAQCIKSLVDQTEKGEILVFNDCSTDNTTHILHFLGRKYDNVRITHSDKRIGHAKGRNFLNRKASGDIIALCDADLYYPNRGEEILQKFKEDDIDIFYSGANLQNSQDPNVVGVHPVNEWDFKSKCSICNPTVAYKREWALKIPYREETIETDLYEAFLLTCHKEGAKFGYSEKTLMLKYEGDSQRNKIDAWKIKKRIYEEEFGIEVQEQN